MLFKYSGYRVRVSQRRSFEKANEVLIHLNRENEG